MRLQNLCRQWSTFLLCVAFAIGCWLAGPTRTALSMEVTRDGPLKESLNLRGQISPGDDRKVQDMVGWGVLWYVTLDSTGGDIESAMRIGRILRKQERRIIVASNGTCASACVFILLGGVERALAIHSNGRIGIHRPHFGDLSPSENSDQVKLRYVQVQKRIREYLNEMNVGIELAGAMEALPPDSVRWLSAPEAAALGILGTDPIWDERQTARSARAFGLTSSQYRAVLAKSKQQCRGPSDIDQRIGDFECERPVLWGLTREEYVRRAAIADREIDGLPRHSNDAAIAQCTISVMRYNKSKCQ